VCLCNKVCVYDGFDNIETSAMAVQLTLLLNIMFTSSTEVVLDGLLTLVNAFKIRVFTKYNVSLFEHFYCYSV
jgi:hypothetical protein